MNVLEYRGILKMRDGPIYEQLPLKHTQTSQFVHETRANDSVLSRLRGMMLRSSGKNSSFFENLEVQAIKHEKARKKGQQHLGGGTALRFAPEKAEAGPGPGGFVAIPGRKVATPDFKRSTMDRFDGPGA